jgi:hypothetical protein
MNSQIKHRTRVMNHGEVFTHEREVNAMLDLVNQETERIDSRFLEPACGTGNFLVEILNRKLKIIKKKYKRSQHEYEKYAIVATSSLYGVDLLRDNIDECRKRLLEIFSREYRSIFKTKINPEFIEIISLILKKNMVCGDALTLRDETGKPIVFTEWSFPYNNIMLKRREYSFDNILNFPPLDSFLATSDMGEGVVLPNILKDHHLINYMRLKDEYS